jgi:hypothetical protein
MIDERAKDEWLSRFETSAKQIPEPRRGALRQEILSDFDDLNDLESYPSPEVIVANELAVASDVEVEEREPVRRRTLAIAAVVIVVIALLLAVVLPIAQVLGR